MSEVAAVMVPVAALKPWVGNPRKNDPAVDEVAASIKRFGFGSPIIARQENGEVIAGHTRLKAAIRLKLASVPVRYLDLSAEEAHAYALADNKLGEIATWDQVPLADAFRDLEKAQVDLSGLGWDGGELEKFLGHKPGGLGGGGGVVTDPDEDDLPEPPAVPVSKPGEVYELGPHRLVCGDSTKAETWDAVGVQTASADAIVTSPPYAVGLDYGATYSDTIASLRQILKTAPRVWLGLLAPGGFCVVNFGDVVSGRQMLGTDEPCEYPMALEYWPAFRDVGWNLWSRRVWCKPNPRCAAPWTASSNRAATDWEHVWTWKKAGAAVVSRQDASNLGWIDTTSMEGVSVGKETHGAGMATGAAVHLICTHSREGSLIAEPFGGTGTTLIAAAQSGRTAKLCELNPGYCDVIRRRWTRYARANNLDAGPGALDG